MVHEGSNTRPADYEIRPVRHSRYPHMTDPDPLSGPGQSGKPREIVQAAYREAAGDLKLTGMACLGAGPLPHATRS